ncbi:hypothetical protein ACFFQF_13965 [Haladaptatus pallidirubidus]|uniref:hypothetical protein n=1 Tax=Haladaptatus pallidirubidus TaxID=1008152 RepID=UPI0035EDE102
MTSDFVVCGRGGDILDETVCEPARMALRDTTRVAIEPVVRRRCVVCVSSVARVEKEVTDDGPRCWNVELVKEREET